MKEVVTRAYDDLHYREDGSKIAADQEDFTVGIQGVWFSLDLTDQHVKEIETFFDRLMEAGHKLDASRKPVRRSW
jgi:hypothetical protein